MSTEEKLERMYELTNMHRSFYRLIGKVETHAIKNEDKLLRAQAVNAMSRLDWTLNGTASARAPN